jgi:SAM-dependent methyltransferase
LEWGLYGGHSRCAAARTHGTSAVAMQPSSSGITRKVRPLIVPDIVADAAQLPFANERLDFVVASHVLEYLPLPLRALANWYSVVRVGGILLLKVPDKRYTSDAGRARTHLEHLLIEDLNPEKFDRRAHFEDWVQYVGARESGSHALQVETDPLMDNDYSIHYHVWRDDDLLELIRHARARMGMEWTEILRAHFYRKECAVALRRGQ